MAYKGSIPRQDITASSGNTRFGVKMLNHFNVQVYIKEKHKNLLHIFTNFTNTFITVSSNPLQKTVLHREQF
jgi:hypothetical protein